MYHMQIRLLFCAMAVGLFTGMQTWQLYSLFKLLLLRKLVPQHLKSVE